MESITANLMINKLTATLVDDSKKATSTVPTVVRGMPSKLILKIFSFNGLPYPAAELAGKSWELILANDWDTHTPPQVVSSGITAEKNELHIVFNELNTVELVNALGNQQSLTLGAELIGIESGQTTPAAVWQFGMAVRNRRSESGCGTPEPLPDKTLSAVQIHALLKAGLEIEFAETPESGWHTAQAVDDRLIRLRNPQHPSAEWSSPIRLPEGAAGPQGLRGEKGERGEAFKIDAAGALSERARYDDRPANFSFMDTDSGSLFVKLNSDSGDWSAAIPFRGPQGNQGVQGEQGVQGAKGDVGEQGPQGIRGERGIQGEQGVQGPKGDTGERGPQGVQGERGLQGEQGVQGLKGDVGERGEAFKIDAAGPFTERATYDDEAANFAFMDTDSGSLYIKLAAATGSWSAAIPFRGPQGVQGETGLQGERGLQGEQGVQGEKGDVGDQGPQGIQGERGLQGERGVQGEKGDVGDQGPQGIQGERGLQGEQGIQGLKGDVGDQGPQGIQGERGLQGEQGIQGEKGDVGDQGPQGIQGERGIQGEQGVQGEKGDTGERGPRGYTGAPGDAGAQGVPGADGRGFDDQSFPAIQPALLLVADNVVRGITLGEDGQFLSVQAGQLAWRTIDSGATDTPLAAFAFNTVNANLLRSPSLSGGGAGRGLTGLPDATIPEADPDSTTNYSIV